MEEGLLKFSRQVLVHDVVISIFKSYMKAYRLEDSIPEEQLNTLVERFLEVYQEYIVNTFDELNIKTIEVNDITYMGVDELMCKISGLAASKLAVELLLMEFILKDRGYD